MFNLKNTLLLVLDSGLGKMNLRHTQYTSVLFVYWILILIAKTFHQCKEITLLLNTRKLKSATQDRGLKPSTYRLYPILSLMKPSDQDKTTCICSMDTIWGLEEPKNTNPFIGHILGIHFINYRNSSLKCVKSKHTFIHLCRKITIAYCRGRRPDDWFYNPCY